MNTLRPVVVAAGLVAGGLFSSAVLACPASDSDGPVQQGATRARPQTVVAATASQSAQMECAYMSSRRTSCCASSLGSRLIGVAAPAGLVAFGLGWLTGGRRRRRSDEA
jgi:hypothetical protein